MAGKPRMRPFKAILKKEFSGLGNFFVWIKRGVSTA